MVDTLLSVIPDTNVLLHFRAFNEIDWCMLVGERPVQLVISSIVLKELDEAKATHGSAKIRDRARRVLKSIEDAGEGGIVREGVHLILHHPFPEHELRAYGLSELWNDDVLIATALYLAGRGDRVVLVSGDTGARLRARTLGLDVREMPDDLRLPPERDALEKENSELKARLAQLQMSAPVVRVEFESGHKYIELPVVGDVPGREWIEKRFAEMKGDVGPFTLENVDTTALRIEGVTHNQINRYNRDCERFLQKYHEYLADYAAYLHEASCRYALPLVIKNDGGSPATDIDLWLEVPTIADIVIDPWKLEEPEAPKPPKRPRAPMDAMRALLNEPLQPFKPFLPDIRFHPLTPPNVDGPELVSSQAGIHLVEYQVRQLKHNVSISLEPLTVRISGSSPRPFAIPFRINAANLREDAAGSLHVKFVTDAEHRRRPRSEP